MKRRRTPSIAAGVALLLAMVVACFFAPTAPVVSTIAVAVLGNLLAAELDRNGGAYARWLVKLAAHWLPSGERERRVEEWEAELADAGEEGLRPVLVAWNILLVGAPLLAWTAWRVGQLDGNGSERNRFAGLPAFVEARAVTDRDSAILWRVLASLALLGLVIAVASPDLAIWLAAIGLVSTVILNAGYAHALGTKGRPRRRVLGDHLAAAYVVGGLFVPFMGAAAATVLGAHPTVAVWGFRHEEIEALLAMASSLAIIMLLVSLIDWYYIRPRIDGLVWDPPCRAAYDKKMRWKRVTRRWFLYRGLTAIAFRAFLVGVAVIVMGMLVREDPADAAMIGGFGGLTGLLFLFAGAYRSELPTIARWVLSPAFVLGDDLVYEGYGGLKRGYVLSVGAVGVRLVPLNQAGQPTDVASTEMRTSRLDAADLMPRSTTACADRCAKLNPDCICGDEDVDHRIDLRRRLLIL